MPCCASSAANMPALVALAVAQPFHMDSSPVRVTPSDRLGATASDMAWPICSRSKPITFPAAQAEPITLNVPWSHPRSVVTT